MSRVPEPCLCGDPECRRCFPRYEEVDEDWAYEQWRDRQEDDRIAPIEEAEPK